MLDHDIVWREVDRRFASFLADRVTPEARRRDAEGEAIPRDVLREAAQLGLYGYALPREVGGEGNDPASWGLLLERLGYLCDDLSFTLLLGLQTAVAAAICDTGRADLIERYVVPMVRGERFGSFGYTENADPFSFASVVRRQGDDIVVNGEKMLITGGAIADTFMTYVRGDSGDLQVVLIHRDDPGVQIVPVSLMGVRAAGLASFRFAGTTLTPDRIMVHVDGLSHVQRFLNQRRLLLTCAPLGRMRAVLEGCIERLSTRSRYGHALTAMQHVQAKLGRMSVAVETATLVSHGALEHAVAGEADPVWDVTISAAKHFVTEQAIAVGQTALHLLGGRGYMSEEPFERALRDFMGLIAGAGAQDVLEVDLGVQAISAWERSTRRTSL